MVVVVAVVLVWEGILAKTCEAVPIGSVSVNNVGKCGNRLGKATNAK